MIVKNAYKCMKCGKLIELDELLYDTRENQYNFFVAEAEKHLFPHFREHFPGKETGIVAFNPQTQPLLNHSVDWNHPSINQALYPVPICRVSWGSGKVGIAV